MGGSSLRTALISAASRVGEVAKSFLKTKSFLGSSRSTSMSEGGEVGWVILPVMNPVAGKATHDVRGQARTYKQDEMLVALSVLESISLWSLRCLLPLG